MEVHGPCSWSKYGNELRLKTKAHVSDGPPRWSYVPLPLDLNRDLDLWLHAIDSPHFLIPSACIIYGPHCLWVLSPLGNLELGQVYRAPGGGGIYLLPNSADYTLWPCLSFISFSL